MSVKISCLSSNIINEKLIKIRKAITKSHSLIVFAETNKVLFHLGDVHQVSISIKIF